MKISDCHAPFGLFKRPFPMPETTRGMSPLAAAITATVDSFDLPLVRAGWRRAHTSCLLGSLARAEKEMASASSPRERWSRIYRYARLYARASAWQMSGHHDAYHYRTAAAALELLWAERPQGGRGDEMRNAREGCHFWKNPRSYYGRPAPRGILREVQMRALSRLPKVSPHPQIAEARILGVMMPSPKWRQTELRLRADEIRNDPFDDPLMGALYAMRRDALAQAPVC